MQGVGVGGSWWNVYGNSLYHLRNSSVNLKSFPLKIFVAQAWGNLSAASSPSFLLGWWGRTKAGWHIWPVWVALASSGERAASHSLNSVGCQPACPIFWDELSCPSECERAHDVPRGSARQLCPQSKGGKCTQVLRTQGSRCFPQWFSWFSNLMIQEYKSSITIYQSNLTILCIHNRQKERRGLQGFWGCIGAKISMSCPLS